MTYLLIGGGIVVFLAVIVALAVQYGKAISKVDTHETQAKTRRRAESVRTAAKRRWLQENRR